MAEAKIDWRYTRTRRREFLRVLAQTYDFDAALTAGRLTWVEMCRLRTLHPEFSAQIEEIILAQYDRLEVALLRIATAALAAEKPDLALAQAVLKLRRPARTAGSKPRAEDKAAREKVVQSIMNKVALLRAAPAGGGGDGRNGVSRPVGGGAGRC